MEGRRARRVVGDTLDAIADALFRIVAVLAIAGGLVAALVMVIAALAVTGLMALLSSLGRRPRK